MIKYAQVQYADTLMQIMEPIFLKIKLQHYFLHVGTVGFLFTKFYFILIFKEDGKPSLNLLCLSSWALRKAKDQASYQIKMIRT